jgi:hypothetical protein
VEFLSAFLRPSGSHFINSKTKPTATNRILTPRLMYKMRRFRFFVGLKVVVKLFSAITPCDVSVCVSIFISSPIIYWECVCIILRSRVANTDLSLMPDSTD